MTAVASTGRVASPAFAALLVLLIATVGCSSQTNPAPRDNAAPQRDTGDPVVVAAGDIADCRTEGDEATARLVGRIDGTTVLPLGDQAYPEGTAQDYQECYEPSWGRFKERTRPVPGNHEYDTPGAEGYFDYFGKAAGDPAKGYYSFNLGDEWHLVALNSNCGEIDGCGYASEQLRWLEADLAANKDKSCTLAYMHHPRFSSGVKHGGTPWIEPLWEALYEGGAEVVLSGHEHNYERFAPQNRGGREDAELGIRQFVVGTGGRGHHPILDPIANSEVQNDETHGVLKLTLRPEGYEWRFVPVEGESFSDSGSASCH